MEVLVPADPVLLTIAWLDGKYPWDVLVTKARPNPTSGRVVTVRRSGGTPNLFVLDNAWLTIECFAPTAAAVDGVSALAYRTWGLLGAMAGEVIDGVQCYEVDTIGGPSDFPDADAQLPRFVMSVQATFRRHTV